MSRLAEVLDLFETGFVFYLFGLRSSLSFLFGYE